MKYVYCFLLGISLYSMATAQVQVDSSLFKRAEKDTVTSKLNMDALYNRPFMKSSKIPVSLGGYFESRYRHLSTDGVSDGHEFHFQRMSIL